MAQYPSGTPTFTTKVNGDTIQPGHVNDVQAEITAIGAALLTGFAHVLIPDATGTRDLGSTAKKWRDLHLSAAMNAASMVLTGSATIGGNATVTGTVTANAFVGDGSGLTDIPAGTFALDDLTDVDAAAPADGEILTWVTANSKWEPATPASNPIPTGLIAMWGAAAAPSTWVLCQGQAIDRTAFASLFAVIGTTYGVGDGSTTFNVPDMQQRFPLGLAASGTGVALGETGGTIDHTHAVASHTHDTGTLAVASHSHSAGTFSVASHTHSSGTLACASHTHGPGTLNTDNSGTHTHTGPSHTHSFSGTTSVESNGFEFLSQASPDYSATDSHTHTYSGTTGAGGTGATGADGNHDHDVDSGVTAATAPAVSGSTGSSSPSLSGNSGSAAPALSGVTGAATPATDAKNPPYVVVNYIIKA